MLKGIYSAAAGMTSQMVSTDIIADNLANVSTPGYKQTGVNFKTFGDVLVNRIGNNQEKPLGNFSQGSQVMQSIVNFSQGDIIQTGNPLDLALNGDGFFMVKMPETESIAYTRAGNFVRDNEGYVTTPGGARLQGLNGDILIPKEVRNIVVSGSGEIMADGNSLTKISIAQFGDTSKLERTGNSLFKADDEPIIGTQKVNVEQGAIERSNSNVITELVNSMMGFRVYETLQKSIQMQNETLGKSVNEVGRVT